MEKYINCLSYIVYTMTKIKPAVASSKDHHDYKWHCNFHLDAVVFDNLFGENIIVSVFKISRRPSHPTATF